MSRRGKKREYGVQDYALSVAGGTTAILITNGLERIPQLRKYQAISPAISAMIGAVALYFGGKAWAPFAFGMGGASGGELMEDLIEKFTGPSAPMSGYIDDDELQYLQDQYDYMQSMQGAEAFNLEEEEEQEVI